jgi:hypothetical protein
MIGYLALCPICNRRPKRPGWKQCSVCMDARIARVVEGFDALMKAQETGEDE